MGNLGVALASSIPGIVSLLWQTYDRVLAKPKLEIKTSEVLTRLEYAPSSWAWIPRYSASLCNPYGAVISIPIMNKGRKPALQCLAKMRFRLSELKEDKYVPRAWSRWFELHWADNPEDDLQASYKPITIHPREETLVDLIVYHTRIKARCEAVHKARPGTIAATMIQASGCILTFYTKPFLRAPLVEDPCCGEPPTIEYLKPVTQTPDIATPHYAQLYEIQLETICENAHTQATLYAMLLDTSKTLEIYAWPSLKEAIQDLKDPTNRKPTYKYYATLNHRTPPPCIP